MKLSILYSFLFAAVLVSGCRKEDNPKVPDLTKVPIPLLTLDATSDTKISGQEPEAFHAKFTVDIYFQNGELPKQLDLVVVKNDDAANAKTVLANITSWPVDFEITGQELIDLFGEPIALGDAFEFSTDVTTQGGLKVAAFPLAGGTPFAPGIYNMPGSSPLLRFAAPCPFDVEAYKTDFFVVRDDWQDYNFDVENEDITVTYIDDTHLSFKYKAEDAQPIIMEIDPETNAITIAHQYYGKYGGDDYFIESIPGDLSAVDPCTTTISVNLHHSTAAGTFDGVIVMQKK
ncbi:MAG: hypothetical protein JNK79_16105 [Chitinophagaceae bacterium]|nr:hypothetical protein [Chitinophagaceae bacterium]